MFHIRLFVHFTPNCMGGVMVRVLALSAVDRWYESNKRLYNWYLLLLR